MFNSRVLAELVGMYCRYVLSGLETATNMVTNAPNTVALATKLGQRDKIQGEPSCV